MHKQKPAFTIIEVVLVLAIAGLIFLMVFIALPALQRNQRNTQYRNNIAIGASMMRNYQTNNRNQTPRSSGSIGMYVGRDSESDHPLYDYVQSSGLPDDTRVKVWSALSVDTSMARTYGRVVIAPNRACAAPSVEFEVGNTITVSNVGGVAVWTILEEGPNGMIYCQDV